MKYPISAYNNLIVKLDKKFQDEIITSGGLKLFLATQFEPGENATITANVVSIPRAMSDDDDMRNIYNDIQPGDEVIFRYLVVCSMNEHFAYPVYENEFEYQGESYWKVPYNMVLGYYRKGELYPASGHVFLEPSAPEMRPDKSDGGIWIPDTAREKNKPIVNAKIGYIGKPYKNHLPAKAEVGDTVVLEKKFIEKYTVRGKKWWVSKQDRILGVNVGPAFVPGVYTF